MILFIVGLLLGMINGMFLMALLTVSSESDRKSGYDKGE